MFFIIGAVKHVKLPRTPNQWHAKKKHGLKGFETRVVHSSRLEDSSVKLSVFKKTVGQWMSEVAKAHSRLMSYS
jgi:hypothetical protein